MIIILETFFFPNHLYPSSEVAPPSQGFVKLNFDGSLNNSSVVAGFIIQDWMAKLVKAGVATYYGDASIIVVEVGALRDGLRLAIHAGFNNY